MPCRAGMGISIACSSAQLCLTATNTQPAGITDGWCHRPCVCRAALAEFRIECAERGRSIFEGMLANYPKRIDIWNVYIDQVGHHPTSDHAAGCSYNYKLVALISTAYVLHVAYGLVPARDLSVLPWAE